MKKSARKKIGFVVNSVSGGESKEGFAAAVRSELSADAWDISVDFTMGEDHAFSLARRYAQDACSVVVAVGGDGTVNEVGRALIGTGIPMGIIPLGSGNGLARHLELPLETAAALRVVDEGWTAYIDVCRMNGDPFFCVCGLGFDAHVGKRYSRSGKRGFLSYLRSIVAEFFAYRSRKYAIEVDGASFKTKAFIVAFANASQWGFDAFIAPNADIQDGLVDVSILRPFPFHRVFGLIAALMGKKLDRSKYLRSFRAGKVVVRKPKKEPIQFDGEWKKVGKNIEISVEPAALRVIVSASCKLRGTAPPA